MALIKDPRCGDALDLLEKKELPGGGWAAEGRFYNVSSIETNSPHGSHDSVDWGGIGKHRMNEWITADALFVLRAAGRIIAKHPCLPPASGSRAMPPAKEPARGPSPVRWAPRVRPEKLRRLYASDARGIIDAELLDDVGTTLFCRCRDILIVSDAAEGRAKCPSCAGAIAHVGDDKDQMLACAKCGWKCAWGDYQKSYRHHELYARGLTDVLTEFMARWERVRAPREKMLLIDRLIHVWHWESRTDHAKGRPAAVNLIEGSRKQVLTLLDELSGIAAAIA